MNMFQIAENGISEILSSFEEGGSAMLPRMNHKVARSVRASGGRRRPHSESMEPVDIQGFAHVEELAGADPHLFSPFVRDVIAVPSKMRVFEPGPVFSAASFAASRYGGSDNEPLSYRAIVEYLAQEGVTTEAANSLSHTIFTIPAERVIFDANVVFETITSLTRMHRDYQEGKPTRIAIHGASSSEVVVPKSLPKAQEFAFSADFVPSKALLNIWIKSLNSHLSEARALGGNSGIELFSISNDRRKLEKEFYARLRGLVVRQAVMYSYSKKVYHLTIGRSFSAGFMSRLADEFMLRIDYGTQFFGLLFEEMSQWLATGRTISGNWGRLARNDDGDLLFYLKKSKVSKVAGFTAISE